MDKLLMIADDLTGALDTGVAFASAGISTCVGLGDYFLHNPEAARCPVQVCVVESRHLPEEEAYRQVYDTARKAQGCGFTRVYKKTDSALRGNIGAELAAVCRACGEKNLFFLPAYPEMGRVTVDGIHYIDGNIPVELSVFGSDPFNPVRHSAVLDVIRETTREEASLVKPGSEGYPPGIAVFDAATGEEVAAVARELTDRGEKLFAGCAGFANALRDTLDLPKDDRDRGCPSGNLVVFCGSINPISLEQCREAVDTGAPGFHLLENGTCRQPEELTGLIAEASGSHPVTVLDTGSADVGLGLDGSQIAEKMGQVIRGVLERQTGVVTMVIGGDTLSAFIQNLKIGMLFPLGELAPGVVLSQYRYGGNWQFLISKSGGFGEKGLLRDIYEKLNGQTNESGRCM